MQAQEPALRRFFSKQPCGRCHSSQEPDTLFVLIRRKDSVMVLVTCSNCHHRGIYIVTAKHNAPAKRLRSSQHRSNSSPLSSSAAITYTDVHEMRSFLDGFNGDFLSLFGSGPQSSFSPD
jgi:predicted RNA-binding protein YlxR (DUF448 family)